MVTMDIVFKTLITTFVTGAVASSAGSSWSYGGGHGAGADNWAINYPVCGGSAQSPIDIQTEDLTIDTTLAGFIYTGYASPMSGANYTLTNNGHTVVVELSGHRAAITGGGLQATYNLQQFHLHWGSNEHHGSEHTVDGKMYAAEIHFVHLHRKYARIQDALNTTDQVALAVLGVLVEESSEDNPNYEQLIESLSNVAPAGAVTNMTSFPLRGLLPSDTTHYYRYGGSLTTPPCNEVVVWTVFTQPVQLSAHQLSALRKVKEGSNKPLVDNYRPVQALHGRNVYANQIVEHSGAINRYILPLPIIALLHVIISLI